MKYVINPGVNPELKYAAHAISQIADCKYFTTFVFGQNSKYEKIISKLPPNSKINKFLARRTIKLDDNVIIRKGLIWEIAQITVRSKFPELQKYFILKRNYSIHKYARKLARNDFPEIAFFHYTQSSESLKLFSSLGCITVLNYPIAHHSWMNQMLETEKQINPNLVGYLQVPNKDRKEFEDLTFEIQMCDFILVGSSFVKDTFLSQGVSSKKIKVINLGMDQDEFQIENTNQYEYGKSREKIRLVFTGQINQRKGLSYLFEALKTYEERVECLIIGLAPDSEYLNQLKIPRNIQFLGYKTKKEMSLIYSQCDVFVFPSLAEGFPLSAIEAMAHGLSLILTKNTFASDVVANYAEGIVIDPHSTQQLVDAIGYYIENPESIEKFGKAAREKSLFFTWDKYKQEITNFVSEISNE